jgi:hypothetical protein
MENNCTQIGVIEGLKHDVNNLVGWQKSQNGSIHRVESKVDNIYKMLAGQFVAIIVAAILMIMKG